MAFTFYGCTENSDCTITRNIKLEELESFDEFVEGLLKWSKDGYYGCVIIPRLWQPNEEIFSYNNGHIESISNWLIFDKLKNLANFKALKKIWGNEYSKRFDIYLVD